MASNTLDLPREFFSEYPRSKIRFVNGFIASGDVFLSRCLQRAATRITFPSPFQSSPPKKTEGFSKSWRDTPALPQRRIVGAGSTHENPPFFRINTHGTQLLFVLFGFVNGVYHPTSRPLKNIGTIMINHRNWGTLFSDTLLFWYFFYCNGRLTHVCRRHSRNLPWPLNFTHR